MKDGNIYLTVTEIIRYTQTNFSYMRLPLLLVVRRYITVPHSSIVRSAKLVDLSLDRNQSSVAISTIML